MDYHVQEAMRSGISSLCPKRRSVSPTDVLLFCLSSRWRMLKRPSGANGPRFTRAFRLPSVVIDAEGVEDVEQGSDEGEKLEGGESDCYRWTVPVAAHPSKGPSGPEAQLATCPDPAVPAVHRRTAATGRLLRAPGTVHHGYPEATLLAFCSCLICRLTCPFLP